MRPLKNAAQLRGVFLACGFLAEKPGFPDWPAFPDWKKIVS
jgi:hypothetical protein